jgi:hypothetical protein
MSNIMLNSHFSDNLPPGTHKSLSHYNHEMGTIIPISQFYQFPTFLQHFSGRLDDTVPKFP